MRTIITALNERFLTSYGRSSQPLPIKTQLRGANKTAVEYRTHSKMAPDQFQNQIKIQSMVDARLKDDFR